MDGGRRAFVTALLLSLGVHLFLAGHAARWWRLPAPEVPLAIEAHLLSAATPSPAPPHRSVPNPVVKTKPPVPAPADPASLRPGPPSADQAQEPVSAPQVRPEVESPPPPAKIEAVKETAPAPPTFPQPKVEQASAPAPPVKSLPPTQRELPEHLTLKYAVQRGEEGFIAGQATYTWMARGEHYSLVSVIEAKGIVSLFISGKIVQTSEGLITPFGLKPEQFWMARGERRQPPIHFDWAQQRLNLPSGGQALPDESQDLLSFPFHLAMTLRDDGMERRLSVTNSKKLREYGFRLVDHESVTVGEIRLDTLHLRGERAGEGSLDVWLAPSRHWLPARIRTQDQKGNSIVLTLEHID